MPRYEQPSQQVVDLVEDTMEKYHGALKEAEVRVKVLFVFGEWDESGEHYKAPIKRHGVRCAAQVKINSLALRAEGIADATITIDAESWSDMEEETQLALLDHELQHLEVVYDDTALTRTPKSDDLGRPVLRMRKHDFEVWGFDCIIRRHGLNSIEGRAVEALKTRKFQGELSFGDEGAEVEIAPLLFNA